MNQYEAMLKQYRAKQGVNSPAASIRQDDTGDYAQMLAEYRQRNGTAEQEQQPVSQPADNNPYAQMLAEYRNKGQTAQPQQQQTAQTLGSGPVAAKLREVQSTLQSPENIYQKRHEMQQQASSDFWSGMKQLFDPDASDPFGTLASSFKKSRAAKPINWEGRKELLAKYEASGGTDSETRELLRQGDIRAGNLPEGGDMAYTLDERLGNIFVGGTKHVGSALLNTAATLSDAYARGQAAQITPDEIISEQMLGVEPGTFARQRQAAIESKEYQDFMNTLYSTASGINESANKDIMKAKENTGVLASAGVDIAENVLQMGYDAGLAAITGGGSALIPMAARVFGQSAMEAREAGASLGQQIAYGAASAGVEVLTEKLGDGLGGLYGKGFADDVTEELIRKLTKSDTGRSVLRVLGGANSEGMEEVISGALSPLLQSIYNGKSVGQNYSEMQLSDLAYDYLISFAIGLGGGSLNISSGGDAQANAELREADAIEAAIREDAQQQGVKLSDRQVRKAMREIRDALDSAEQPGNQAPAAEGPQEATGAPVAQGNTETAGKVQQAPTEAPALLNSEENAPGANAVDMLLNPTAQPITVPSQQNIDSTAPAAYTKTEGNGGITNDQGRSAGEAGEGLAPGEGRLGAQYQSGDRTGRGPESAGIVRVDPELQKAYEKSGVVDYGLRDSSDDSAAYSSALEEGRNSDPKHGWMVTPQSAEDLQGKMSLLAPDNSEGAVVTKDGDIEGVFKNQNTGKPGALMRLLPQAVAAGGTKLDCYGEGLVYQYAPYGFRPVARVEFNPEYANPGWDPSKGTPYVYIMVHDGSSPAQMVENKKNGNYHKWTVEELNALPTYDKNGYDDAMAYRDSILEQKGKGGNGESGLSEAPATTAETAEAEAEEQKPGMAKKPAPRTLPQDSYTEETGLAPREPSTALPSAQEDTGGEEPVEPGSGEPGPGMKRSQTESNTLQSIARALGGQQQELYYPPKSEKESLTNAVNRVNADMNGEMQKLMDKEMWTGEDIDTALTIQGLLQMDGVRTGDFSAAQTWARIIRERGTKSGQALQAFSKWTRSGVAAATESMQQLEGAENLSEEEKTRITNDVYQFAQEYDSIEDGDLESLRDLIKRQAKYRNTWTFGKKAFGRYLNEVNDFDWLKEYALRQIMNMSADYTEQADLGQKLKTWQVNAQLFRLGTFFRNLGGDLFFGVQDTISQDAFGLALDYLVSKATGHRAVPLDKSWFSSAMRKGAREGLVRSILEVAGDVDMGDGGSRYGTSANRTFKMTGNGFERFMSRLEQILGYSLTSSDRTFRGGIEAEQARGLEALGESAQTQEEAGENMADYRLFQNKDISYSIAKGVHDVFNLAGVGGNVNKTGPFMYRKGGFGLADVGGLAYPGVPSNIGVKPLEHSPANIVKGGIQLFKLLSDAKNGVEWDVKKQQNAVMNVARGFNGSALIALLVACFKAGVFRNEDDEDDADAKALAKAEGKTGVQINLSAALRWLQGGSSDWKDNDKLMSIGWLEPMNAFMAISSMIADEGGDLTAESIGRAYANGMLQSVMDLPVMESVRNIYDNYNYSPGADTSEKLLNAGAGFLGDAASGMIPAPISQVARAMDEYDRDVTGDTKAETALNSFKKAIPGLRQTLPEKLDNFGNPIENGGSDYDRWMNSFVRPGAISKYQTSDMYQALDAFREKTGDASAVPDRKAPNSFSYGADKIEMSADEKRFYQKTYGKTAEDLYTSILLDKDFKDLSDSEKTWLLDEAEQYATYKAKKAVMAARGQTYENKSMAKLDDVSRAGVDIPGYLLGKKNANADGEGSLKNQEVYDWLTNSKYTNRQKAAIWDANKGSSKKTWNDYYASNPITILANAGMSSAGAKKILDKIDTSEEGWSNLQSFSQDELWEYYKANPKQEKLIQAIFDAKGLKTTWEEYKKKHG